MTTAPRRVLSLATLYPNRVQPRFGTFVARSLEALAARGDWHVTVINPIGVPPLALGQQKQPGVQGTVIRGPQAGLEYVLQFGPRWRRVPQLGNRMALQQ